MSSDNDDNDTSWIIKLRGLPWTVSAKDILNFLDGVNVINGENGIHLITYSRNHTRPNGEAFVECASAEDYKSAFQYDKKNMGHRYIEIFSAKQEDFETIMRKQNIVKHDTVVKLRGLPWGVTEKEIATFFEGLELNHDTGIHIQLDRSGRASGEAFVQFKTEEDCEKALKRNLEKIGHRYIEIFRSSSAELRRAMSQNSPNNNRPTPYDRNGRGDRGGRMNMMGNNMRNLRGGNNDRRGARDLFDPWDGPNNFNNGGGNNFNDSFGGGGGNGGNSGGMGGGGGGFGGNNCSGFNNGNNGGGGGFNNGGFNGGGCSGGGNFNGGGFGGNSGGGGNNSGGGNFGGGNFGNNDFGSGNGFGNNFGGGGNSNNGGGSNSGSGYGALNTLGFGGLNNLTRGFGGGNNCGGNLFGGGNNFGNNNGGNNFDPERDGFCVHLRGMPYYCDDLDIYKFFSPLKPVHAKVIYNNKGLHSGGGNAYFSSHEEAQQALKKDKEKMGSRYIELFYDSPMSNNKRGSRRF